MAPNPEYVAPDPYETFKHSRVQPIHKYINYAKGLRIDVIT